MSQMPPPYNPPPPGFGPPPGFPPQFPPGGPGMQGYGGMPQMPRTSAAAVTSLILGLLLCLPLGIIAIITGIVGISVTKNPYVRGRGMAITGLLLGFIGLLLWGGVGVGTFVYFKVTAPQRMLVRQFTTDLSQGRVDAAAAVCGDGVKRDQLQSASDKMVANGAIVRNVIFPTPFDPNQNATASGAIVFANGQQMPILLELHKETDGSMKITRADIGLTPANMNSKPTPALPGNSATQP